MKNKFWMVGIVAIAIAMMTACSTPTPAATEPPTEAVMTEAPTEVATEAPTEEAGTISKICLVTDVGKVNDGTFNQFAYEGFTRAAKDFSLESKYIETQAQTDYANNIKTCVDEGFQVIVTVGFLITDATAAAAKENPEVYFVGIDQGYAEPLPNLVGVQFREDQAGFLAGALAAQVSKSGTIAGVYGIDVPAVKKYRLGFENGAKYINPDIKTLGVYEDSFVAPDKGKSDAEQFIGEGADVIFGAGGQTGSGGIKAAAEKNVYVIGVDQDEYLTTFGGGSTPGAKYIISSATKRVDNGVYAPIKALIEGIAWPENSVLVLDAAAEGVGFAPKHDSDVPDEVIAKLEEIFAGLADGSIDTGVDPVSGDPK
jgi:basic membrane lipoprotein Med (substrate-binding protein (PBP1-ABC) superfamily)